MTIGINRTTNQSSPRMNWHWPWRTIRCVPRTWRWSPRSRIGIRYLGRGSDTDYILGAGRADV